MIYIYNANPLNVFTDDCTIRAISVAEGTSWDECYGKLSYLAGQEGKILNDVNFIENYLDKKYPRQCYDNVTVGEFSKMCPKGHFVVTMRNHIVAIIDNVIVDTFDCSNTIMKCSWRVK